MSVSEAHAQLLLGGQLRDFQTDTTARRPVTVAAHVAPTRLELHTLENAFAAFAPLIL